MKNLFIAVLIVVLCLVVAGVAIIAWAFGPKWANLKSEYMTAEVIIATHNYVAKTSGQWPRSWADLELTENPAAFTRMRFDLDPATATESEVMAAIAPLSGKYLTYPHAQSDLHDLFEALRKYRHGAVKQPSAGNQ